MRSGWARDAHQLIFDVGPLGDFGHGHADLLSVQCAVFGAPCLVDAGTYCYTAVAGWRDFFRSTAAHSTVTLDGLSQAIPAGPFNWQARPSARVLKWQSTATFDFADAEHDAYCRLADPVTHRRRVLFVKPRFWVLVDDLDGTAEHRVDLRFQLEAQLLARGARVGCVVHVGIRYLFDFLRARRLDRHDLGAARKLPKPHQRLVGDDAREPGRELRLAAEARERVVGLHVGFLQGVLGFRVVAQDRARGAEQHPVVLAHDSLERPRVDLLARLRFHGHVIG